MNVSSIKALCWLTSSALLAGLGLFVHDFFQTREQRSNPWDHEHAQEVLNRREEVTIETQRSIEYTDEVKPAWIGLNWTGKEPPKPVIKEAVDEGPKGPVYIPVADLLAVSLIRYDTIVPEESSVLVFYKGGWTQEESQVLKPGDTLPAPNDFVKLVAVTIDTAEFAFEGESMEGRENEQLGPSRVTEGDLLALLNAGASAERPQQRIVQQGSWNTAETKQVGPNRWILGYEDVDYLNENFSEVLVRDIKHRTHYDRNGKRAGIELTSVRSNSIAARHGAQEGDVVISINGKPVNSAQEAINYAKNNADKYSTWEVVVENLGSQRTLIFESPSN